MCRAYGLFSLGRFISPLPLPRKNHQLVTSGMYSECPWTQWASPQQLLRNLGPCDHAEHYCMAATMVPV
jgi:hypothetical protein